MFLAALILYLIPHKDNNHRPKLLNPILVFATILAFFATQIGLSFVPQFTPVVLGYVSSFTPQEVIELSNNKRADAGLPQLKFNTQLSQAAQEKAEYMFKHDFWAHTAPDGTEPWKFVLDADYKYRYAGENLARDFATADGVVAAWMDSPSHRDNVMSSRYQDIGVAVVKGNLKGVQTTLVVQFFGTKMSQISVFEEFSKTQVAQASTKIVELPSVQGTQGQIQQALTLSPFWVKKNIGVIVLSIFLLVLSIDMVIIKQNNVARVSSKSFAHFLFFGMITLAIIISKAGNIL